MYKVSDYPEIKDSYFLKGKDQGASKKLLGKIAFMTVFMNRSKGDWSQGDKNKYYALMRDAKRFLKDEAKKYDKDIDISLYHFDVEVPKDSDPHDDFDLVKEYFHSSSMEELQSYYEKKMTLDEVVFVLAFKGSGRSFAVKQRETDKYRFNEISVIFFDPQKKGDTHHTIAHELLHQFGAIDYYFPEKVEEIAKKYIKNSVMGIGEKAVDDLTAYLIGWKSTINAGSYHFLKETMWINEKVFIEALKKAWGK